ncbi:MAG: GNAT family acetyltransferase [Burkholderiaceae bacterium]|jgi:ribosomal protein S18 acetylase RimI-like enzyme|nr:GNAT family acetyltransferase [Burkholderiaceae bacterium]MEB2318181.1 GNAT family acetyltransferase [Pseudomonadota bacterium]
MNIRPFAIADEEAVIALWQSCELVRPWNDPRKDIRRKLTTQPELFLVGEVEGAVVATVMAGFDGHRGWVNYLAVSPEHRRSGFGRAIMDHVEACLKDRGCPKLNLQVRASNHDVLEFYRRLGYAQDEVVSLGKRLIPDAP